MKAVTGRKLAFYSNVTLCEDISLARIRTGWSSSRTWKQGAGQAFVFFISDSHARFSEDLRGSRNCTREAVLREQKKRSPEGDLFTGRRDAEVLRSVQKRRHLPWQGRIPRQCPWGLRFFAAQQAAWQACFWEWQNVTLLL